MRPTRTGVVVTLAALLLLALGVVLGYPELVTLGSGAVAVVTLAATALLARTPVQVRRPDQLRVERDAVEDLTLVIELGRRRGMGGLRLCDIADRTRVVGVAPLRQDAPGLVAVPVPTGRRGAVVMGPWRLERCDPWGLFTRTVARVGPTQVLVVPRVHPMTVSALPLAEADGSAGEQAGSTYVATLREYVVGDELRKVHWRSSAKAGHLMVRQYVDAHRPGVDVVLDLASRSYLSTDDFEEAVDAAASVAAAVATTGVPTRVVTTQGESARAGLGRHAGMLDLLASVLPSVVSEPIDATAAAGVAGSGRGRDAVSSQVVVTGSAASAAALRSGARRLVVRVGHAAGHDGSPPGIAQRGVVDVARAEDLSSLPTLARAGRATGWAR